MSSPTKVDTSTEPDTLPLLRMSCFRSGKAAAGGSSGTVTVYDCRMLGARGAAEPEPTERARAGRPDPQVAVPPVP